ncbi:MAG: hypothetical protein ACI8S6_005630 [Myxococcota bacterium]|jgi:hypothetical protein
MARKLLIVEGATDVSFFHRLMRDIPDIGDVKISPPGDYKLQNTVTVMPVLLPRLLKQLETQQLTHLGVVVDADHTSGGGAPARWTTLTDVLRSHGYRASATLPALPNQGSMFQHSDGLPPVVLWLMPDHQGNGMLEDLMLHTARTEPPQDALMAHATQAIRTLPVSLFSAHQHSKGQLYTWLAWQRRPGLGLRMALDADLLDPTREPLQGLRRWLAQTFQDR